MELPYHAGMNDWFLHIAMMILIGWVATWLVAALFSGTTAEAAPRRTYVLQLAIALAGFYALFLGRYLGFVPMWRTGPVLGWSMIALELLGIAFAWWARIEMGRLWSGNIVRKEGHRVVETGPFALVRHPIYAGISLSVLAIAVIDGAPVAFAGAALIAVGFALKARVEERFLEEALPDYAVYRTRVPMLVPRLR